LYYIQHWSVWFDLEIALRTVLTGFINKTPIKGIPVMFRFILLMLALLFDSLLFGTGMQMKAKNNLSSWKFR